MELPNLPTDLINYILDLEGGISHRKLMKEIVEGLEIKVQAAHKKVNNLDVDWLASHERSAWAVSYKDKIMETWDWEQQEFLMIFLDFCNCCERHKKNRYHLVQDFYRGHITYWPPSELPDNPCKCKCRHTMRQIVRANFI